MEEKALLHRTKWINIFHGIGCSFNHSRSRSNRIWNQDGINYISGTAVKVS
jgi:hypothetical protein